LNNIRRAVPTGTPSAVKRPDLAYDLDRVPQIRPAEARVHDLVGVDRGEHRLRRRVFGEIPTFREFVKGFWPSTYPVSLQALATIVIAAVTTKPGGAHAACKLNSA
jgi:hypothetical protein